MDRRAFPDPAAFIAANLPLTELPDLGGIRLHVARPGSRLSRLLGEGGAGEPPYWAYPWAGGLVLARYLLDQPEIVAGKRVLDLGAGSGLVAIAAVKAGAKSAVAAEIDRNGLAAIPLNAAANGITIDVTGKDLTQGEPPDVDIVLVGDLFYAPDLAQRVTAFLDRCLDAKMDVLVGDPERAHLPHARLRRIAEYEVPDFGSPRPTAASAVFAFTRPAPAAA
ncbi:SAM-dependent methyltransferase [Devosia geojensis]|uniref:SAM-dependent methyltransferase n=1 Tax=Devosia geojensis TaxID=443610 RepID=A0A0F5FQ02_9HYPH|nr:50S ribosomal protein L11 methyltransferase [Devosia geojensis]KKB10931.1 SAM-dependent methyltransferase [Devosia geojensis]